MNTMQTITKYIKKIVPSIIDEQFCGNQIKYYTSCMSKI